MTVTTFTTPNMVHLVPEKEGLVPMEGTGSSAVYAMVGGYMLKTGYLGKEFHLGIQCLRAKASRRDLQVLVYKTKDSETPFHGEVFTCEYVHYPADSNHLLIAKASSSSFEQLIYLLNKRLSLVRRALSFTD